MSNYSLGKGKILLKTVRMHGQEFVVREPSRKDPARYDERIRAMREEGHSNSEMCKVLGISEHILYRRMRLLGITEPWTKRQELYLRENYLKLSDAELGEGLGIARHYVSDKLRDMGLSRPKGPRRKNRKK